LGYILGDFLHTTLVTLNVAVLQVSSAGRPTISLISSKAASKNGIVEMEGSPL
jgi:hypothetical protein